MSLQNLASPSAPKWSSSTFWSPSSRRWWTQDMTTASLTRRPPCWPAWMNWERGSWLKWSSGPRDYQVGRCLLLQRLRKTVLYIEMFYQVEAFSELWWLKFKHVRDDKQRQQWEMLEPELRSWPEAAVAEAAEAPGHDQPLWAVGPDLTFSCSGVIVRKQGWSWSTGTLLVSIISCVNECRQVLEICTWTTKWRSFSSRGWAWWCLPWDGGLTRTSMGGCFTSPRIWFSTSTYSDSFSAICSFLFSIKDDKLCVFLLVCRAPPLPVSPCCGS